MRDEKKVFESETGIYNWNRIKCMHKARCINNMLPEILRGNEDVYQLSEEQDRKLTLLVRYCPSCALTKQEFK